MASDEYFDDDDIFDDEEDCESRDFQRALNECGQTRIGVCLMAGTEYCDFDCPFRNVDLSKEVDGEP